MRVFAAVASKSPMTQAELAALAIEGEKSLPFYPAIIGRTMWLSPSRRCALLVWSNDDDDLSWEGAHQAATFSGLLHRKGSLARAQDLGDGNLSSPSSIAQLGGAAAVCLVGDQGIRAWNMPARLEHVYWCAGASWFIASSRALTAYALGHPGRDPTYSRAFIRALLGTGYPATEAAPFEGVEILPPDSELFVSPQLEVNVRPSAAAVGGDPEPEPVGAISSALVDSVSFLADASGPVECALTGGKDSRLILATLRTAGVDVTTFTGGVPEHPDVVVAREIASRIGVPHRIARDGEETEMDTESFLRREVWATSLQRLRASDGAHSVFETIGSEVGVPSRGGYALGGQGGEVLRGGYAKREVDGHADSFRRLSTIVRRYREWMHPAARTELQADLSTWWMRSVRATEPGRPLWGYYVQFRSGRWAAAGWAAASVSRPRAWPFYDSQVVRAAAQVEMTDLSNESVFFAVLEAMDPRLAVMPLAGARWNFEKGGPRVGDEEDYESRKPVEAGSRRGAFDWRFTFSTGLAEIMADQVLTQSMEDATEGIVRRATLEELVRRGRAGELDGDRAAGLFLWSAFTIGLLTSNKWLAATYPQRSVRIPFPTD